jgi:hypothetical protein
MAVSAIFTSHDRTNAVADYINQLYPILKTYSGACTTADAKTPTRYFLNVIELHEFEHVFLYTESSSR